jgi:hypothetical protein
MVWVDVSSRERRTALRNKVHVLWAATLFATLQFKLSPTCPTATDGMKHISDGDAFRKASMDPLLKDGL